MLHERVVRVPAEGLGQLLGGHGSTCILELQAREPKGVITEGRKGAGRPMWGSDNGRRWSIDT